ncbi:uncharacterized protein LOC110093671 [Dendrobium catenatum]|uniref:uncharacterized protein LOC110093671 n=1 Tax=Dendrobium catenatum TaxID=906689 RepID=UPI0009F20D00|nr:uncharacterized protein LOC110093671 [Dendrobium catenatum]
MITEQCSNNEVEDIYWKWLRDLKLSRRVELFWWRLNHNAIHSNEFLMYRRLINYNGCPRGCGNVENVEHIAVQCSFLHKVIENINKWGYNLPVFSSLDICYKELLFISKSNPFMGNLYCTVVFYTWKSRSKLIHDSKEDSVNFIAANAISLASSSNSFNLKSVNWDSNRLRLNSTTWNPPPTNWIKFNVDAALHSSYKFGIGGIIRDCKGRFLFAFGFKAIHWDSSVLELEAILSLRKIIQDWMYEAKGIIIEGDNFNVMKFVKELLCKKDFYKDGTIQGEFFFLRNFN